MKPNLTEIEDPLTIAHDVHYFSRKLDGYFASYDVHNECFVSSAGNTFCTPVSHKLDSSLLRGLTITGELVHRDGFQSTSVVRKTRGNPSWEGITFHPFDLHTNGADYQWFQRYRDLLALCKELRLSAVSRGLADLVPIIHKPFVPLDVQDQMSVCREHNFEGLVFRNERTRLSDKQHGYKWKVLTDMEGELVAYESGTGRCRDMVGASLRLRIRNPLTGKPSFVSVGSGLDDSLRRCPPSLHSTITFTYRGLSKEGIPQKPTFKQVR